jgi:hypothetical protein
MYLSRTNWLKARYDNRNANKEWCLMTVENQVRILAGSLILISVALVLWVSQYWLLLTTFVGLNLLQSAFTGICPAETIFKRLSHKNSV